MQWIDWMIKHWEEVLAFVGIGTGSGIAGTKLIDRQQNASIKKLEERMEIAESKILDVEKSQISIVEKLATNTILDKQLRIELQEHRNQLNSDLSDIKSSIRDLTKYLMNK